jgi:uncharacterized protein YdeI (BOF family)
MKMKTLLIATAVIVMATGGAFAQTSGSSGSMSNTGGTQSQPESGSNASAPTAKDSKNMETQKDKSPASTNSGTAQDK